MPWLAQDVDKTATTSFSICVVLSPMVLHYSCTMSVLVKPLVQVSYCERKKKMEWIKGLLFVRHNLIKSTYNEGIWYII